LSAILAFQTGDDAQQGGLATAGRAEEADELAFGVVRLMSRSA